MSILSEFKKGKIHDVTVRGLSKFIDERGWLAELFRADELEREQIPVMSYISMTLPGIARGPHEHREQTDYFCFIGPSNFKVYFWDARLDSPSYGMKQVIYAGTDCPLMVIVPPGIVHAYRNIGIENGIVFNAPNQLYAGEGKRHQVDEIRHEESSGSLFLLD